MIHRLSCVLFVLAAGASYLAPAAGRGAAAIALHLLLTALMFAAWRHPGRWAMGAGIAARLLLVATPLLLSHDVERYLWDGRAALAGLDPYRVAPAEAALEGPLPSDHAQHPTLYPPGALGFFSLAAAAGPGGALLAWKALVAAASIATLLIAARLLRRRGLARHLPLVALSPLLVVEGGVGAHVDLLALLAVALALLLAERGKGFRAGVAVGAGILLKLFPGVLLFPLAAGTLRKRRLLAGTAAVVAGGVGVALALGLHPGGSLVHFLRRWRFGSPLFEAAHALGGDTAARAGSFLAMLLGLLAAARLARRGERDRGLAWAFAAPLLASAVVYPWYLAPLALLVAFRPSGFLLAWLAAAPLTYEVLGGSWAPAAWPLWAIAGAWGAGLAIDRLLARESPPPAAPAPPRISIVIPTLEEERHLPLRLRELEGLGEVIVVDGGSRDGTVAAARAVPGVRVLSASRGRALQMNAGARLATGEVLLFLHADVSLPHDATAWIAAALADPGVVAGAFRTWTVGEGRRPWLAPFLHLADVRSRWAKVPYGDQALFVRAEAFRRLGGFAEQPLMEDVELGRRLSRLGRIRTVAARVRVSGRRYGARSIVATLVTTVLPLLYRLGVPAHRLARWYGDVR